MEYIPKDPEREGYTFGGWFKEPECINEWDFEVDILPKEKKEEKEVHIIGETLIEEVAIYQETILYAKWIQKGNGNE
ncbi:MAG: InlB B-repeat-containing protein [Clostridia bacterium]|nr:InlB B-repeat-containing protein [Clostridia bacterium]